MIFVMKVFCLKCGLNKHSNDGIECVHFGFIPEVGYFVVFAKKMLFY